MMLLALALACTPSKEVSSTPDSPLDSPPESAVDSEPWAPDPEALAQLERTMGRTLNRQAFATGASLAIWRDGAIVYAQGFGTLDDETPVDPDALFQIGSDTKKLTAIAVLQQVQAGTLALDAPLTESLPHLSLARSPGWAAGATLHDLLSHQGGLYDYTPWSDAPDDSALDSIMRGTFAENEYAMAPAGAFWNYSNPNFSLAGRATERAAGQPWADLIEDGIFAPLGMTHSFAREADLPDTLPRALGHGFIYTSERDWFDLFGDTGSFEFGAFDINQNPDNAFVRPAGLVWSTASDMATLGAFLIDGDPAVLDDGLLALVHTQHVNNYPSIDIQGYGYGLWTIQGFFASDGAYYDVPFWLHGGNTLGFTSLFWVLPEQRLVVSILSNGYGDDFSAVAEEAVLAFADLPEATTFPGYTTFEPNLADYVGHYEDPGLGSIDVALDGDGLTISIPALEAYGYAVGPALNPYVNEIFTFNVEGSTMDITFVSEEGVPQYAVNRLFVGTRTASLGPQPQRLSRAQVDAMMHTRVPSPGLPHRP